MWLYVETGGGGEGGLRGGGGWRHFVSCKDQCVCECGEEPELNAAGFCRRVLATLCCSGCLVRAADKSSVTSSCEPLLIFPFPLSSAVRSCAFWVFFTLFKNRKKKHPNLSFFSSPFYFLAICSSHSRIASEKDLKGCSFLLFFSPHPSLSDLIGRECLRCVSCKRRQVLVCVPSAGAFILMKKEADLCLQRPDLVKSQRRRRGRRG